MTATYHRLSSYLKADTDKQMDLGNLSKSDLHELAGYADTVATAEGIHLDAYRHQDGIQRMKKEDAVGYTWANFVKPIIEARQAAAAKAEADRVAKVAAEAAEGKVAALRAACANALQESIDGHTNQAADAAARITANPFGEICSYAKQLWTNEFAKHDLNALRGWLAGERETGKQIETLTEAEVVENLKRDLEQTLERVLSESYSKSTCQLSNIKDECELKARSYKARILKNLIAGWKNGNPERIRAYAHLYS